MDPEQQLTEDGQAENSNWKQDWDQTTEAKLPPSLPERPVGRTCWTARTGRGQAWGEEL